MPGDPTSSTPVADQNKTAAESPRDPFGQIVSLARSAPSRSRYMAEVLRAVGSFFASPYAAMHVRYSAQVLHDDCHYGPTNPGFWKPGLQDFLTESLSECRSRARLLRSKKGSAKVAYLSSPLYDPSGPAIGALSLVIQGVDEKSMTEKLAVLDALCRLASFAAEHIGRSTSAVGDAAALDRSAARAAVYSNPVELAFAITNELRNKTGCEQIALGLVQRNRVRLLALSGFDQIARKSPGVAALQHAMEECLDAAEPVGYAASGEWSEDHDNAPRHPLHKAWHDAAGGASVASVPLRAGDQIVAILSVRLRSDQPVKPSLLTDVRERTEPFMPMLKLLEKASRGIMRHVIDGARAAAGSVVEPGRWGRRVALATLAAAATWFVFGTLPYSVTGTCVLKPSHMRHLAAPIDGVLTEAFVVAGAQVTAGQLLCRFDDSDLRQQEAQLLAEWDVLERRKDRAMAANQPVEVRLAEADQTLVSTKLDIVRGRIARLEIRAPFDGVVTSGDLRQAAGSVLRHGTPLFAVAPLDEWTVEIRIPEFATADVVPHLTGSFASIAQPERKHSFEVDRVIPYAEVHEKTNVFIAEGTLRSNGGTLKPGMEGVGSIYVGSRRAWWVVLHRMIDYVRLTFWV